MKRIMLGVLASVSVLAVLLSCAGGRGRGPVDTIVFPITSNPGLPQDLSGYINIQTEPKEVTIVVAKGTDVHALVARLSLTAEATITVISSGARVVQQNGVTPNDFSAPVMYSIEVPGQKEPWHYRVTVREAEANARLGGLSLPGGSTLQPAFNPAVHAYRAQVPFASTSVRIEVRAQSRFVKSVFIDGAETPGAAAAAVVDFQSVQQRPVTVDTVAEDGVTKDRYVFTLVRAAPDNNGFLAALDLQGLPLAPAFSPTVMGYQVTAPFETQSLVLHARLQSAVATMAFGTAVASNGAAMAPLQFSGDPMQNAGAAIDFSRVDDLPLVVAVTAQDGTVQQYLLDVRRAPPDTNNFLADLTLSDSAVSPQFLPSRNAYVADVPPTVDQIRVMAHPQSRVAGVELSAALPGGRGALAATGDPVSPDGAVIAFPPNVDRFSVLLSVTAQSGDILRYIVDVRRPSTGRQILAPKTEAQKLPPAPPSNPPASTGVDHVSVSATGLVLGKREMAALVAAKEGIGATARVTVRAYRSAAILAQDNAAVVVQRQGTDLSLSLSYRSAGFAWPPDRLIEVEVAIPTSAGRFLSYTEALRPGPRTGQGGQEMAFTVPFLVLGASPQVAWPQVGSPVIVAGYIPIQIPGRDQKIKARDDFVQNQKGEMGINIEISDPATGRLYGKDAVWRKPGAAHAQPLLFAGQIQVPEGAVVRYAVSSVARNGKVSSATGQAQVWTTRPRYDGGFEAVLLPLADDLEYQTGR